MKTENYCAKTSFIQRKNAASPDKKLVAIDIGYSSVKCCTDDSYYSFLSMARPVHGEMFGETNQKDIFYRDKSGTWRVGNSILSGMSVNDTSDSENTLYSRDRYESKMFKVIYLTGMGLCLLNEPDIENGNERPLYLQTGLPPAYLKSDKGDLVSVLSGDHSFEIKVGQKDWKTIQFTLPSDRVLVMPQPQGSLYSASLDNNCRHIQEAAGYFDSNILVLDPGFGTFDTFAIKNRQLVSSESFPDFGMRAVYKKRADEILLKYNEHVSVHSIPKILTSGYVQVLQKKPYNTKNEPIEKLLTECSFEICMKALETIRTAYDYLREFQYLLVTGGTGQAWLEHIKEYFEGLNQLKIITGNQNDNRLPQVFSNVRGYYLFLYGVLSRKGTGAP